MNVVVLSLGAHWVSAARLPKALHAAGFQVFACCPEESIAAASRHVRAAARFTWPASVATVWLGLRQIHARWPIDVVLPGDEASVRLLHAVARHDESGRDAVDRAIMARVRASLGDPDRFLDLERKSALAALGPGDGLAFPPQAAVREQDDLVAVVERIGYPAVVKKDHAAGGLGVAVVRNPAELARLIATSAWFIRNGPHRAVLAPGARLLVQRFVEGWEASVSFAAVGGHLAASFAYRTLCRCSPTGPTSVAELIQRDDLTRLATAIVRRFGFTGLGGVDVMIDGRDGTAVILEFNARPTITTHLGAVFGSDLCRALRAALAGEAAPAPEPPRHRIVALFPGEWQRDATSPYLETAHHDVPWDEPDLMAALVAMARTMERPGRGAQAAVGVNAVVG